MEDLPLDEEPGEITRFEPPATQFPDEVIAEARDWLSGKFVAADTYNVESLLRLAEEEALASRT